MSTVRTTGTTAITRRAALRLAAASMPNCPRLRSVKRTYDPDDLFTFPQAVTAGA